MPDGRIEPRQVERLKEKGAWLVKNGESIYGTRGGPWKSTKTVASTRKASKIFVHLMGDANMERYELRALPRTVKSAATLSGSPVKFAQQDGKLILSPDRAVLDPIDAVVRIELDNSAMDLPAVDLAL